MASTRLPYGLGDRHDPHLLEEAQAERPVGSRLRRVVGFAEQCLAEHGSDGYGHVALGHQSELGQDEIQPVLRPLLQPLGAGQPGLIEQASAEQIRGERRLDAGKLARRTQCVCEHVRHGAPPRRSNDRSRS